MTAAPTAERALLVPPTLTRPILADRRTILAAVVIGVLAAAIAATGSWIPSLWGDEAASLLTAQRSLPSMSIMIARVDAVHVTYYLGLHAWIGIAGTSPFALRLPSALAVGAASAAVVLIGARMGGRRVGLVAGVASAVLPRMTYIGEEARSYAFSAAVAAWLTLVLLIALRSRSRRVWVVYGALLAVGIYTFFYLGLLALAHGLVLLLIRSPGITWRRWRVAVGAALLAASPLIVAAILQRGQIAYLATRPQVSADSVLVAMWFGQPWFAVLGWALVIAGLVAVVRRWRWRATDPEATALLVVAAWALVPSAVLIGSSPLIDGFTARYLAFAAPAIALLMAAGLSLVLRRRRGALAIGTALVVAAALPVWASQRGPYSKNNSDWQAIGQRIQAVARPGDALVFDEATRPSRRPRLAYRTAPQYFVGLTDPTLRSPYTRNSTWYDLAYSVSAAAERGRFAGVTRVWLIEYATPSGYDRYGLAELRALGFRERVSYTTFRSRIIGLTRPVS